MPPWNLPNSLIYLQAIFRPRSLRPDVFVPTVSHVDWPALKRLGYNGVVVDKDNCLTWPEKDELHPSIKAGWKSLRDTFGSHRILVVSNSAGTLKDPGGIAAESVSRHLQVPVLLHAQPKPGCAGQIMDYFQGRIGINRTTSVSTEGEDVPIMKMIIHTEEEKVLPAGTSGKVEESDELGLSQTNITTHSLSTAALPLRLLIIGDRLATDVLLARRLRLHLPATETSSPPRILSIITTQLFKPSDVRFLRWLESKWSTVGGGNLIESGRIDWGRYVFDQSVDTVIPQEITTPNGGRRVGLHGRWVDLKSRMRRIFTISTARRMTRASMAMMMKGLKGLGSQIVKVLRRLSQRIRREGLQPVKTTKST